MNSNFIGWAFGIFTIFLIVVAVGVSIYLFGISTLIGLITNNSLCCLFGAIVLVVLLYIFFRAHDIWFKSQIELMRPGSKRSKE